MGRISLREATDLIDKLFVERVPLRAFQHLNSFASF